MNAGTMDERTRSHVMDLGNEDLVEYIQSRTEVYQAEAIEFARQELNRRELGT